MRVAHLEDLVEIARGEVAEERVVAHNVNRARHRDARRAKVQLLQPLLDQLLHAPRQWGHAQLRVPCRSAGALRRIARAARGGGAHLERVGLLLLEQARLGKGLDEAALVHEHRLARLARLDGAHDDGIVPPEGRQQVRGELARLCALLDHLRTRPPSDATRHHGR